MGFRELEVHEFVKTPDPIGRIWLTRTYGGQLKSKKKSCKKVLVWNISLIEFPALKIIVF